MDILTVVIVFLVLEALICGVCGFVCRERRVPHEGDKRPTKTSHPSATHPPRIAHGVDHQETWSHGSEQPLKRHDSNIHLTCFRPSILP
jgi:hypothetical protein